MSAVLFIGASLAAFLAWKVYVAVVLNSAYGALICLRSCIRKRGIYPGSLDQKMLKNVAWDCYGIARNNNGIYGDVNRTRLLQVAEIAAANIVSGGANPELAGLWASINGKGIGQGNWTPDD
jgi:hypothetical protein